MQKQNYKIVLWQEEYYKAAIELLNKYQDSSLFLLSNLRSFGPKLSEHKFSGDYKLILDAQDQVVAVFVLTCFGTMLLQTDRQDDYSNLVLDACIKENLPLKGIVAEHSLAQKLYNALEKNHPDLVIKQPKLQKDILYSLQVSEFADKWQDLLPQVTTRSLTKDTFDIWRRFRQQSDVEMDLPSMLTDVEADRKFFYAGIANGYWWGAFENNNLIAMASYNAHVDNLAQLGNVYTDPKQRKRGVATKVIRQIILDSKKLHNVDRIVLFTGDYNVAAQKVYERLGFKRIGYFALFFWQNIK